MKHSNTRKRIQYTGNATHPLYAVYNDMLARCYRPKTPAYKNYGGRGIKVCSRWKGIHGFQNFVKDMPPRPDGLTLDRQNNDGNYDPVNCRWSTRETQSRNRRPWSTNISEVAGVGWYKQTNRWRVQIQTKGKNVTIGYYLDLQDAIDARIAAEKKYWALN